MSDRPAKPRGLGRGLSALMADIATDGPPSGSGAASTARVLPIEVIAPNPEQPRKHFADDALDDLAASIRARGILQPLIVRPDPRVSDRYEIVAGERRWRAAQRAQVHELPVIVRELSDIEVLEIAIIENVQRADLNPVEEAMGYRQLIDRFGHTQEQLGQALGKSRSHIANVLRLLNLPEEVLEHLRGGRLSAGHARALITAVDPAGLAQAIIDQGLSVRETERRVREAAPALPDRSPTAEKSGETAKDADTRAIETDLSAHLGMAVSIDHRDVTGAGQVTIRYRSLDQLDRLCQLLSAWTSDETR